MDPITLERDLASLPREHLLSLNVELPRIVTTVYTVLPRLRLQLAQMPGLAPGLLDKLTLYVDALVAAHAGGGEPAPADSPRTLVPEARAARERRTTAVEALVLRGIVSASGFDNMSNRKGYSNLANDLRLHHPDLSSVKIRSCTARSERGHRIARVGLAGKRRGVSMTGAMPNWVLRGVFLLGLLGGCGGLSTSDSSGELAAAGGTSNGAEECAGASSIEGGCGGEGGANELEAYARLHTACNLAVRVNRRGGSVCVDTHIR